MLKKREIFAKTLLNFKVWKIILNTFLKNGLNPNKFGIIRYNTKLDNIDDS